MLCHVQANKVELELPPSNSQVTVCLILRDREPHAVTVILT